MNVWRSRDLLAKDEFFEVVKTTPRSQFATMVLQPGQVSGELGNEHPDSDQWLIVVEGSGELVTDAGVQPIGQGDVVLVPAPENHQFRAKDEVLRTITFYGPPAY
ncbi:MAG TPA: cupin domain-containing protein [Fimbriimonadaceae bacterium]|nr:cupin domain-containing protein [Fimbriimonadaceae bacterium]